MQVYALNEKASDFEKVLVMTEKMRGLTEAKKLCTRILNDPSFDETYNNNSLSAEAREKYMNEGSDLT